MHLSFHIFKMGDYSIYSVLVDNIQQKSTIYLLSYKEYKANKFDTHSTRPRVTFQSLLNIVGEDLEL